MTTEGKDTTTSTAPANTVGGAVDANDQKLTEAPVATELSSKVDESKAEGGSVEKATTDTTEAPVVAEPAAAVLTDKKVEDNAAPATEKLDEDVAKDVAVAPTAEPTTGLTWPETAANHPLTIFFDAFEALVTEAEHNEVYGIQLAKSNPFHTKIILQKFLRANQNDLEKAKQQLLETLKWRKTFDPVKAMDESFDKSKFGGLGYVLEVEGVPESPNTKDVVTFNIYGAVKDKKATFGDLEGFLRWRVGLMEKSVQKLNLKEATKPIPNYGEGPDPYQGFQIHDYLQVSFLRQDPNVKAATQETIKVLGRYYPETLSRKFFVNVPVVMGWVYTAVKMVVAKETAKKFTVLSYGNQLVSELGENVPVSYGGKSGELESVAEGMKLIE